MALETFKKLLRSKATELKANLTQKRIDALAAKLHAKHPDLTEDADHEERINDFNDVMPFVDIAKDDDRIRTNEAKDKNKNPSTKTTTQDDPNADDPTKNNPEDAPPSWAKPLFEKLSKLESEKAQGTNRSKVVELLKAKGIPEILLDGRTIPEKEEDVEQFVETVSTSWGTLSQDLITQGLMSATPPGGGDPKGATSKAMEAAMDTFVASKVDKKQS